MKNKIFRQEAIDHYTDRLNGNVMIYPSQVGIYFLVFLFTWFLIFTVALVTNSYSTKITVDGWISDKYGSTKLYGKNGYIIKEVLVSSGQTVEKGQPLVVLATSQILPNGDSPEHTQGVYMEQQRQVLSHIAQLRSELYTEQTKDLDTKITNTKQAALSLKSEHELFLKKQSITQSSKSAQEILHKKLLISEIAWGQVLKEELDEVINIKRLESEIREKERLLQGLENEKNILLLSVKKSGSEHLLELNELAQKSTANEQKETYIIQSPAKGIISNSQQSVGQSSNDKIVILSIIPSNQEYEVKAFIPNHQIATFNVNQVVNIRYNAFPYEKYGSDKGVVMNIASSSLLPQEVDTPLPISEPGYQISIALESSSSAFKKNKFQLKSGMTVKVDISNDKRSLLEWVLKPLFKLKEKNYDQ